MKGGVFVRTSLEGTLREGVGQGGGVPFALAVYYVKGLKNVKGHLHEWRGICQNECVGNIA